MSSKDLYKLSKIAGTVVYETRGEPWHYACPMCMDGDDKRIILKHTDGERSWHCPRCGFFAAY